jgi:2,3-dihydroxybenzoate decarboxylase
MLRMRKIVIEEHFMAPGFDEYTKSFSKHIDATAAAALAAQLSNFTGARLDEMDAAGIDFAILSQAAPSVQGEPDTAAAIRRSQEGNDFLRASIDARRDRFGGFATLPMQDARAAAREMERCVREHGFFGALVNGQTGGIYYDNPEYDVVWETMQGLDVPFYLHPANLSSVPDMYLNHPELQGAVWGWGVETATHALRLLFSGIFDRFPKLKVILGHMGETLPYLRWRFDSRFAVYTHGIKLKRKPSEYIGSNILITTSGVCSDAALIGAIGEVGIDAVMFSVDYPYESTAVAAKWIDGAPISEPARAAICHGNAERIFKLNREAGEAGGLKRTGSAV